MKENKSNIVIDIDTNKMIKRLRVITKHISALVDELESIDEWQCDCNSCEYSDFYWDPDLVKRVCDKCGEGYLIHKGE